MTSDSMPSFVNGFMAGAGAVLALMSVGFVMMTAPLEGIGGFTSVEMRVAILLGGIVFAVAVGYEFYGKKKTKEQNKKTDQVTEEKHTIAQKDEKLDE